MDGIPEVRLLGKLRVSKRKKGWLTVAPYIMRRALQAVITVLLVSVLTFLLMRLAPGDPAAMIAMARSGRQSLTAAEIAAIHASEHLDSPLPLQYGAWLSHSVRGDFGRSLVTGHPVVTEIVSRLPATLELAVSSILLALLAAVPLGILAAAWQGTLLDRMFSAITAAAGSIPAFWLGYLLILLFAVQLRVLPAAGKEGWQSAILPVLSIAPGLAAVIGRLVRANMIEALGEKYVRTARAKGLSKSAVLLRHALPNALSPVLAITGLQVALLLEGAVVVEAVFAWPGVGRLLVSAVLDRDFSLVEGLVVMIALSFVSINFISDIAQALVDPRLREWRLL
jgi:peptide/nickel transport system permease protein